MSETEVFDQETPTLRQREEGGLRQVFTVKAVETMHTEYDVLADDEGQAADRLRRYFADPGMVAAGVVVKQGDGDRVRWRIPSTERVDGSGAGE